MRIMRNNPIVRAITMLGLLFAMLIGAMPAVAAPRFDPLPPEQPLVLWGDTFGVGGIATNVPRSSMDVVHGPCHNTLGASTEDFLSNDCGKYLGEPGKVSQADIDRAKGAIGIRDGLNHFGLNFAPPAYVQLPEGGWDRFSLGWGTIRVIMHRDDIDLHRDIVIKLYGEPNNNYHVYITGFYGDAKTPTDRNTDVILTDYQPGNVEAEILPSKPNGGWVSEGTALQMVDTSMGGSHNCGDAGCAKLTMILINPNNERVTAIRFTAGNVDKNGKLIPQLLWTNAGN